MSIAYGYRSRLVVASEGAAVGRLLCFWLRMALQTFTKRHHEAALLLAEDEISDEEIGERCGVSRQTIANWKKDPGFAGLVGDQVGRLNAAMLRLPIAKKRERLKTLDKMHRKALGVIEARGEDMEGETPGGETGLLVRQTKQIGSGRDAYKIEEYAVDVALMREIRALEEQAAKELGQWVDKREVSGEIRTVEIREIRIPRLEEELV